MNRSLLLLALLCSCAGSSPPPGAPPAPPPPCADARHDRQSLGWGTELWPSCPDCTAPTLREDPPSRLCWTWGCTDDPVRTVPCWQVLPPERLQCSQDVSPEDRGCPEDRCTDPCAECRRTYSLAVQPYVECNNARHECYVPDVELPSGNDWPPM